MARSASVRDRNELGAEPGTKAVRIAYSCNHGCLVLAPQSGHLGPCSDENETLGASSEQLDTQSDLI